MIPSIIVFNKSGLRLSLCRIPEVVAISFVRVSFTFNCVMFPVFRSFILWGVFFFCSALTTSFSLILSKAFVKSIKHKYAEVLYSMAFSLICLMNDEQGLCC
jgi:hypothetical protein